MKRKGIRHELFRRYIRTAILSSPIQGGWNGEKLQNIRKICAGLKTIHLEIYDDQSYVIVPFTIPDKYGCDSKEGMAFPIKESVEFVATIKARQALLPREEKKELLDTFIEEYNDFCRSEDKLHWIPKKLRELKGFDRTMIKVIHSINEI